MAQTYQNQSQDKRLDNIEKHIEVINSELGCVKEDVSWLKQFFWLIAGASISGLVVGVLNLLLK